MEVRALFYYFTARPLEETCRGAKSFSCPAYRRAAEREVDSTILLTLAALHSGQSDSAASWPHRCHMMPPQGSVMGGQVLTALREFPLPCFPHPALRKHACVFSVGVWVCCLTGPSHHRAVEHKRLRLPNRLAPPPRFLDNPAVTLFVASRCLTHLLILVGRRPCGGVDVKPALPVYAGKIRCQGK